MNDILEKKFITLMKKEGLDKYSSYFGDLDSFEEIPLFSRFKDISFLDALSFNDKNKFLINKGIDIIKLTIKVAPQYLSQAEIDEYFIGLSITDWCVEDYKEINCLTPNIFISRKKTWLLSSLELTQKNSIEENLVKEYLCSLNANDNNDVYVANKNSVEFKRVYIFNQSVF